MFIFISNSNPSIYETQQYSSSTFIWIIHVSVGMNFPSMCFISGFPLERVTANNEANEPRFYGHNLRYGICVSQMTMKMLHLS
jgi:hypothetical protein